MGAHEPQAAPVRTSSWRGKQIAFRLEVGDVVHVVVGDRARLGPDVGDPAAVRAATIRVSTQGLAVVQLGLSRSAVFLRRLSDKDARKQWPQLVEGR